MVNNTGFTHVCADALVVSGYQVYFYNTQQSSASYYIYNLKFISSNTMLAALLLVYHHYLSKSWDITTILKAYSCRQAKTGSFLCTQKQ